MTTINQAALHILQHSLGLDEYGEGRQYRNHYVTSMGSEDYRACMQLVSQELMTHRNGNALSGGSDIFIVTPQGIDYVALHSPKRPKLTRSKARYLRFLDVGDCFASFRDFLLYETQCEREGRAATEKVGSA